MLTFITFGGGGKMFYDAVERLTNQASNLNLFNNIVGYTDKDLLNDDIFNDKHYNFIQNNKRGYGYWIWKPYLIKKTMEKMNDNDILLYLDCGCEIDIRKKDEIIKYIEYVKNYHIIGTETFGCLEKQWCKMDLILKLDMLDDHVLNSIQRQAGLLLILVCTKTREFINEWYNLCCEYHNIDDTPSINKNLDDFIEHRHDQSIFSLLTKKYNFIIFKKRLSLRNCINVSRNFSKISNIR